MNQHNHITRDIKPIGQCPACDEYHYKPLAKAISPDLTDKPAEKSKVREWWIDELDGSAAELNVSRWPPTGIPHGGTHVIEYAAFEAVKAERDEWERAYSVVAEREQRISKERDRLEKENAELREVINHDIDKVEAAYRGDLDRYRQVLERIANAPDGYQLSRSDARAALKGS